MAFLVLGFGAFYGALQPLECTGALVTSGHWMLCKMKSVVIRDVPVTFLFFFNQKKIRLNAKHNKITP